MPRYFFHTRIGDTFIEDPHGVELRDPDEAWRMARGTIRQIFQSEGQHPDLMNASIEVVDEAGDVVLEFPFTEVLLDLADIPRTKH